MMKCWRYIGSWAVAVCLAGCGGESPEVQTPKAGEQPAAQSPPVTPDAAENKATSTEPASTPANTPAVEETPATNPVTTSKPDPNMNVTKTSFGVTSDGKAVDLITLTNRDGMVAKVISYGATLVSLEVPDKEGQLADVVLGYDTLAEYEKSQSYFGSTIGRYGNRIGGAKFTLDGTEYTLAKNNGENSLHGGIKNFSRQVWGVETSGGEDPSVTFSYISPDMEEGFPGEVKVFVTYTLTEDNRLRIDYQATSDKKTIINLTNHAYYNLAGHNSGDILGHYLLLRCDAYLPVNAEQIPTLGLAEVKGTPFDFTSTRELGDVIEKEPGLYDHCFAIKKPEDPEAFPEVVATLTDPKSGRKMELYTTEPGVQLYTANHLDGEKGKGGAVYNKRAALCLETQHFPDSPNQLTFPTTELEPGKTYRTTTVEKFSWK